MSKGKLIDALKGFTERNSGVKDSILCKVITNNFTEKNCYCEAQDGTADIVAVKYQPNASVDGYVIIPKENSYVIVSYTNTYTPYISMFSEVEEIHLAGVAYGGLAKTNDVKTKLNNLENKVNALITAMSTWVVVPNDGGLALKTAAAGFYGSSLTLTTQSDISSTKVKHGDNT
jgi:hypothetical protein